MFRKAKQTIAPLPKPPTESQMLEDLQLFHETRPAVKHTTTESNPTESEVPSMDDWWNAYEASLETHEHLQDMKANLDELKKELQRTRAELQAACDDIQAQIDKDLERLRVTTKGE